MRYKVYRILFVLIASLALQANARSRHVVDTLETSFCFQQDSIWQETIKSRIDTLLQSDLFRTSTVGIEVYDLTADSVIYAYNEQQRIRPASTMKMVVAVAALDRLGGSHLFKTSLHYTGSIDSCVLRGNIYCKGGMDPRFNSDDMNAFIEGLKKMNIDTIRGNIYADLSMKEDNLWGEGWCWDDENPILSPLLISGKNNFMSRFYNKLYESGITLVGDTLTGTTPKTASEICMRFHTIDQILIRMMKESDNLYAESMFYQLATASGTKKAGANDGRNIINKLISKLGLNPDDYYIADGSGLSLYNYLSPDLEVRFLRYAYQDDNIYIHLLPSLPIAGIDGTLSKRMKSEFTKGNVKAKTGTVTGVSTLTGYCTAANGHQLCFSIMNTGIKKAAMGRDFQDKVCEALCQP